MEAIYVDLHIHTSENADNLNKNYNIDELIKKNKTKSTRKKSSNFFDGSQYNK